MKIAALCDFPFWASNVGTGVRHDSLCRSLSTICDLTVISTVSLHAKDAHFAETVPYRLIARNQLKTIARENTLPEIPGVRPDRDLSLRTISHIVSSEGFDAVLTPYFNRKWMIEHLPPHLVRIIDTHDCQTQRTASLLRHGIVPTFLMNAEEEGRKLADYDVALAMSSEDQAEFSAMTDIPVITAPFRVPARDLAPMRHVYGEPDSRNLLFIAAQSPVNDMTLDYLMREIMPLVPGNCVLTVIGNVTMPPNVNLPHVTVQQVQGVEDLVPLYARADVALNPTFAGGGVKTKTLEAMAFGVPVVTCDEGARGLRHLLPDDLVVNDKELFAHRIGQLLAQPERRAALAREVLDNLAAEDAYDWLPVFADVVQAAIAGKRERYKR
ncbi:glycosyltransferase [Sulfitobacter sp. S190]|uniref:glycosyltransferase n=1 Tax=Sulfitobacter sp. S190 TaxID=2867022 RepID=UPI0021A88688|nr:glycosyltransferase [Sulfitobacter sp. S190]UWR24426.1 glycosyltransferase [Sulfitobacter sp. S190]